LHNVVRVVRVVRVVQVVQVREVRNVQAVQAREVRIVQAVQADHLHIALELQVVEVLADQLVHQVLQVLLQVVNLLEKVQHVTNAVAQPVLLESRLVRVVKLTRARKFFAKNSTIWQRQVLAEQLFHVAMARQ
jgi:hypothetical protein